MTNTPTVDDDFSSSLTSFFPYYSKSNEEEYLGKAIQLLRKCGGRTETREETGERRGSARLSLSRLPHSFAPSPPSESLNEEPKAMYTEFRLVKGSCYVGDQQINRHDLGARIGLH